MEAAALATLERAVDDEFRDLDQVAQFKEPRLDAKVPIVFPDLVG
jgi:hypothetical protein